MNKDLSYFMLSNYVLMLWMLNAGGNAGLATAYAARKLNIPATIIVPSSSPKLVLEKLQDHGASVRVVGKVRKLSNVPI